MAPRAETMHEPVALEAQAQLGRLGLPRRRLVRVASYARDPSGASGCTTPNDD